jgi:hypothetical protein
MISIAGLMLGALCVVTVATACSESDAITPIRAILQDDQRELIVAVSCAQGMDAEVVATPDEVRVENITGDVVGGDCQSVLRVPLTEPLGNRALVVDGEVWRRQASDCAPIDQYGPAEDELPGCFTYS